MSTLEGVNSNPKYSGRFSFSLSPDVTDAMTLIASPHSPLSALQVTPGLLGDTGLKEYPWHDSLYILGE